MGCGPTPSTYRPQHLNKQTLQRHDRGASSCRYFFKSPKLLGYNFLAIRRSDPRPPIFTVSITLPRSPVSLSSGDEVPHIFTRNSRLRSEEFLITSAKRLLQQYLPLPDSCSAANRPVPGPASANRQRDGDAGRRPNSLYQSISSQHD